MQYAFTALVLLIFSGVSYAQDFPSKPVRVIVPAGPGGGTDILLRIIAPKAGEVLRQNVIVENRAGGATNIGTEVVARAVADGYTLLAASTPHAINPSLFPKLNFDPIKDFTPVAQLATVQTVLVVHPSLPVKNVKELIALAKSRPGQLNTGTSAGTGQFLAVELFKTMAGIDAINVPYKGGGPALIDLLSGYLQFQVNTLAATMPHISADKLRVIAVCGAQRSATLPNVPTVGETVKGFESAGWYALFGPAGMPVDIVRKLNDAFVKSLSEQDTKTMLARRGVDVVAGSPEALSTFISREIPKWGAVVKAAGLTPQR